MTKIKYILISIILIFLMNRASSFAQGQNSRDGFETLYRNAIANAIYPDQGKISANLTEISKANPRLTWKTINNEDYLLVVSWQADTTYYNKNGFYNTGDYIIWVTAAPELKDLCTRNADDTLRLKQRFGLPPDAKKKYFVEFWVKPSDLFRPCPDREVNDRECQLCFPANADSTYINWFNTNRINSYYNCNLYNNYPWTQLGYTYDWNPENKSHRGVSEFIIGKNKNILVKSYIKTGDYCKKPKK
jgi:hypothetical protein